LIHPISFLSAQMFSSGHGNPLCIHSAVDTVHRFAHDLKKILLHWLATETKQKSKKVSSVTKLECFSLLYLHTPTGGAFSLDSFQDKGHSLADATKYTHKTTRPSLVKLTMRRLISKRVLGKKLARPLLFLDILITPNTYIYA
jgi:hypothetical protein